MGTELQNNEDKVAKKNKGESMGQKNTQLVNEQSQTNEQESGEITVQSLRKLIEDQEYRCALSGVVLSPSNASLDHIQPLVNGGDHVIKNVQILHPTINTMKAQMEQSEFIKWCSLVASNNESVDYVD